MCIEISMYVNYVCMYMYVRICIYVCMYLTYVCLRCGTSLFVVIVVLVTVLFDEGSAVNSECVGMP